MAQARQAAPTAPVEPDQAHVMVDVGYNFGNLWFAGDKQNWALAGYYLDTTRSHLKWAVRIQPVRTTASGAKVDLNGILDAVDNSLLAEIDKAIKNKDGAAFKVAYHRATEGCFACHSACEKPFLRVQAPESLGAPVIAPGALTETAEAGGQGNDVSRGKAFFQQNCALCHATKLGPGNMIMGGQGPSLVGVAGRRAGTAANFSFTKALMDSKLVWDEATLDHFLSSPMAAVPGTSMPVPVSSAEARRNVIAYLSTLTMPAGVSGLAGQAAPTSPSAGNDPNDWRNAAPGVKHHFTLADLPAPFATASAGNGPHVVKQPADAVLSVPPGFKAQLFATGLSPRLVRLAPNGDIFIAETYRNRIRVLRAEDGADAPSQNEIFTEGLDRPFGFAFYPPGNDPKWIYIANNNSIVRLPYHNGDLKAAGQQEVIVPKLANTTGGHTTRDVAFSNDGKKMFITIGSGSNIAEEMDKKDPDFIRRWEAENGFGAAWGPESNRANIIVTDPEARQPFRKFATGIRNGAVINMDKNGVLWVCTNERDGLGDNLVPDYITRVKAGGFYGWPWYYMGNHEDPRHAGERPDLAGKATVPDVMFQSHSASLEFAFYNGGAGAAAFPKEYRGDIFAALHGSWNRSTRTGYKVVRVHVKHGVPTGEYDDFLTGFVVDDHDVWGRPVGIAVARDGALLMTEDGNGTMWRISYTGK